MTGIEAHVLRYWETVFPQLRPMKGKSGARRYKESDVALILELQDLIHHKGYSTGGALKVLEQKILTVLNPMPQVALPFLEISKESY